MPHWRKTSRVRTWMPGALECALVDALRSMRVEAIPWRARPSASESPTGPAPTIATGVRAPSSMAYASGITHTSSGAHVRRTGEPRPKRTPRSVVAATIAWPLAVSRW
jgi:hypothetical protein